MLSRRQFIKTLSSTSLAIAGAGLYTWQIEPHWLDFVFRPMPIAGLPPKLRGLRLVQLSDIHIGNRVSDEFLKNAFDKINSLSPDFIVYTGDFISYDDAIDKHFERLLPSLPLGRLGTVGILGNHDYGPRWSHPAVADWISDKLKTRGIQILRNESAMISGLKMIGLDDLWAKKINLKRGLSNFDLKHPTIVLSHNPDTVDLLGWEPYQGWILSGHTHGGQCKPPFLPPPLLPVKNKSYTSGEFNLTGNRKLYISRGLGHLTQVRFNVRPEVTVFELLGT